MKKYLMTGVAALALCAGFTACSSDEDLYDSDQVAQNEVAKTLAQYQEAFVNAYGKIDTNHTWGFGQFATTRALLNMNGNMWETCPELKANEETDVTAYVNMTRQQMKDAGHKYTEKFPENLVNYFVTQVHCGTDTYYDNDGNGPILGSSKMNHLQIAETASATITDGVLSDGWFHVNNFNRGDDTDWNGNTLVEEGGTFDFAYIGSEDSKYHNKWIAVDGADISSEYAGYYYICFDFEQSADAKTAISFRDENNDPQNGYIDGAWDKALGIDQILGKSVTIDVYDWQTNTTTPKTWTVGQEGTSEWKLDNILNGNQMVEANDVYTDWIIRLVKATPSDKPALKKVRVICEDMSGTQNDDFDFNDAVFDLTLDENDYVTEIEILNAGAEYGISVDGKEIHDLLGLGKNPNRPEYYVMGGGSAKFAPSASNLKPQDIVVVAHVVIETKNSEGKIEYKRSDLTLTSVTGKAPGKILVKPTFEWCAERQAIDAKYPKFAEYVSSESVQWYE